MRQLICMGSKIPVILALSSVSQSKRTEIQNEGSNLPCRPLLLTSNTFTCFKNLMYFLANLRLSYLTLSLFKK